LNISTKIIIPFLALLTLLIGVFGYLSIYLLKTEEAIQMNNQNTQKVNDISTRINLTRQITEIYTLSYRFSTDSKFYEGILQNQQAVTEMINQLRPYVVTQTGKDLLSDFENSRKDVQKARLDLLNAIDSKDERHISRNFYTWQIAAENSYASLLNFTNYNLHSVERNELAYRDVLKKIYYIGIFLILFTALLIAALYFYLRNNISQPIKKLSDSAQRISGGDFDTRISLNSNDELGLLAENLNTMSTKLKSNYKTIQNEVKNKERELKRSKEFEMQKDNFMNIASHELKTPVTSLRIFGQLLQRMALKNNHKEYYRYLNNMEKQIDKLTSLVSGLLDITKLQTGKMPYNMSQFDLNDCLSEIVEVSQEIYDKHKIILQGTVNGKVYADCDRISQVVENFISNAIKYSPNANKVILKVLDNSKSVTVSVQDFGIGIDKKHQAKIFDRFFRVSTDQEITYPGLGIGLYLCMEIIKRHNGKIWIESSKGKGSTFYFQIPHQA
jgi:signal transduction histidine kinase